MARLEQLNLRVRLEVKTYWQEQALAAGKKVSAWLESVAGPGVPPNLATRVVELEERVSRLEASPPPHRAAGATSASSTPSPPAPSSVAAADVPEGAINTTQLAEILKLQRSALNARIHRKGGPIEGLVLEEGWRCLGKHKWSKGGPKRALWVPVSTR